MIRFLKTDVVGEDLFEGKSHDRIADNIVKQINSGSSSMIGIEGGWGSGKSNIVKTIQNKLNKPDKSFLFFLYNAWLHQDDLHRRIIPLELMQFLISQDSILKIKDKKPELDQKLAELLGNFTDTTIIKKAKLSRGVFLVLGAIFITSTSGTLAQALLDEEKISFYCFLILSLAPVLAIIAIILGCFLYALKKFVFEKERIGVAFLNSISYLLTIYQDKENDSSFTTYIKEKNPSASDFKDFIKTIKGVLGNKKLVIVFDDMDRMETGKIYEFWGALHNLFSENKHNNIFVIVPFDRVHIKEAFDAHGDEYISKTFDVIYRVSPPIMSDYTKFFKKKWIEAFGEEVVPIEEYNRVLQAYDIMNNGITPRNIIAFINEFVTLKQIFDNKIPERYIAIFILNKDTILKEPEEKIITLDFLGNLKTMYANDPDMSKFIASLVFQIDPDKALDVVYKDRLRQALDKRDTKDVDLISSSDVFFELLVDILPEITNLENAIMTLEHISEKIAANPREEKQIWDNIYKLAVQKEKELPIDCNGILEYQRDIVRHIQNDERFDFITNILFQVYNSENDFSSVGYYKISDAFSEELNKFGEKLDDIIGLPEYEVSVEQYIELVKYAKADYTKTNLRCPLNILDEYLSARPVAELEILDFVQYLTEKEELDGYQKKLGEYFTANVNQHQLLPIIIARLKDVNATINVQQIQYAPIINMFAAVKEGDNFQYDLIAIRLALPDRNDANFNNIFTSFITKDAPDEKLVVSVANVIQFYASFGDILINLSTMSTFSLYKKVAQYIVENNKGQRANIIGVLENFQMICEHLEVSSDTLLKSINGWLNLLKKKVDSKFVYKKVFSPYLLTECTKSDSEIAKYCIEQTKIHFDTLTKEKWIACLSDGSSYEVSTSLIIDYSWNQQALEALQEVFSKVANGELLPEKCDHLAKIANHMVGKGKKLGGTFNSIRNILRERADMNPAKFKILGSLLFKFAKMDEHQEILRTIIPVSLLDDKDCLNALVDNKSILPAIVKNAGEESEIFIEGLRTRTISNPQSDLLKILAGTLGCNIDSTSEKDDENP